MSLDKGIASGKERRKPHRGSRAVDPSCRAGGDCPACESNRTHATRQREAAADASAEGLSAPDRDLARALARLLVADMRNGT